MYKSILNPGELHPFVPFGPKYVPNYKPSQSDSPMEYNEARMMQITRDEIGSLGLTGSRRAGDMALYAAKALAEPTLRGQYVYKGANRDRWENKGQTKGAFFNHAFVPTTVSVGQDKSKISFMISYVVVYSSFPLTMGKDSSKPGLLPFQPQYADYYLQPNADEKKPAKVHIERNLIGDMHCKAAILASLENSYCQDGAWISIYPYVPDTAFAQYPTFQEPHRYRIEGASLGMCVFSAVSGWSPYMYTGWLKYILPGAELAHDLTGMEALAKKDNLQSAYVPNNSASITTQAQMLNQQGTIVNVPGMVKATKQLNFVENVGDLMYKIMYAAFSGAPLIFPARTAWGSSMYSFLNRSENMTLLMSTLEVLPHIYTTALMQDGCPIMRFIGNARDIPQQMNLCMASTISDMIMLQGVMAITSYGFSGNAGVYENAAIRAGAAKYLQQKSTMQQQNATDNRERHMELHRLQKAAYETGNFQAVVDERQKLSAATRAREATKKKTKKAKSTSKKATIKDARDVVKNAQAQAIAAYNAQTLAAKSAAFQAYKSGQGPPPKTAMQSWFKANPRPKKNASVKHSALQEIAGVIEEIKVARQGGYDNLVKGMQRKLTGILQKHGINDPSVHESVTKQMYPGRRTQPAGAPAAQSSFTQQPQSPQQQPQPQDQGQNDDDEDNTYSPPDIPSAPGYQRKPDMLSIEELNKMQKEATGLSGEGKKIKTSQFNQAVKETIGDGRSTEGFLRPDLTPAQKRALQRSKKGKSGTVTGTVTGTVKGAAMFGDYGI